jgi:hypothetical protein
MPFVVPHVPDDATTSGSMARGTPSSSSSSSLHASVLMSKRSVRDAFVTSVACTAPPVRRHNRYESIVPNASEPARAAAAMPFTLCSIQLTFVPEKYGSSVSPVSSLTRASLPWFSSSAQRSAVRRSCHTIALCAALPVLRSQMTLVSRWFVMPIAAIDDDTMPFSACDSASRTDAQMSSGSCSTQPGCG